MTVLRELYPSCTSLCLFVSVFVSTGLVFLQLTVVIFLAISFIIQSTDRNYFAEEELQVQTL